ncbi:cytochrome P450 [Glaciimonas sp. PAMC28666]|uniref:cytochrome P450 n=1 Tax=Glaciimonas sp. PAMC28666 TaxID=2807626 RepID=UPI00196291A9|nr:cytochrome P450 [Glaciimonas sp. PAMC28666]
MQTIEDIPGPRGLPVLSNLLQLKPSLTYRLLCDWADHYGSIYAFRIASRRNVTISDATLIDDFLRDRPEKFRRRSAYFSS